MNDASTRLLVRTGFALLAIAIPMGATLELLHGFKVQGYLASELRRELWRLAHAHGTLLGILCLTVGALAERWLADEHRRRIVARALAGGAIAMPIGFFTGGISNAEGDPSLGIALVPIGAALLFVALVSAALVRSPH